MGFDKPDLGFVVHLGAPQSPIAYYQQIGRAGRGVDHADVILLPGREDADIWAYFGSLAFPAEAVVRRTLAALADAGRPLSTAALETRVDLSRSRLEMMLKVLDVDGAVQRVTGGWAATGQPWSYDADRYARVAAERAREQQAMLGYIATTGCRMDYLRRELDDPAAAPCGRCDNCTGRHWPDDVPAAAVTAARDRLLAPGMAIEPRKMWPTGMRELGRRRGRQDRARGIGAAGPSPRQAGRSRLGPAAAGGARSGGRRRAGARRPGRGRRQGPGRLAVGRPACRRASASRRAPGRSSSPASPAGSPRSAGCPTSARSPTPAQAQAVPGRQYNSAQRLRAVWESLAVPDSVQRRARATCPDRCCSSTTCSTPAGRMTVAAMRLRAAGASGVLPLVLAAATA